MSHAYDTVVKYGAFDGDVTKAGSKVTVPCDGGGVTTTPPTPRAHVMAEQVEAVPVHDTASALSDAHLRVLPTKRYPVLHVSVATAEEPITVKLSVTVIG